MSGSYEEGVAAALRDVLNRFAAPRRPVGIEIFSDETMDRVEANLAAACDADDAIVAATTFIKASIAGATPGGIILTAADLQALTWMLALVKSRAAAARGAAEDLHNWIHE